jgi:hypothetical protein
MKRYADLLADALQRVREIQPWDLTRQLARDRPPLLLDVREPANSPGNQEANAPHAGTGVRVGPRRRFRLAGRKGHYRDVCRGPSILADVAATGFPCVAEDRAG